MIRDRQLFHSSFDPTSVGWDVYGGTSEATPLFSGIIAFVDQMAGHRMGDIHRAMYTLYQLSQHNASTGGVVKDSTDNSYQGVTGYTAVSGYDMATGVGTVDSARFVPALAAREPAALVPRQPRFAPARRPARSTAPRGFAASAE